MKQLINYYKSLFKRLLIRSEDIKLNPGSKKNPLFLAFIGILMDLIQSHAFSHNTDITFLSETCLDSSREINDPKINILCSNLFKSDHPSNTKRGGVCMFYKECVPINRRDDLCTLPECIVTEINIGNKSIVFTCSYRSPSQITDEIEVYCRNLKLILSNVDVLSPFWHVLALKQLGRVGGGVNLTCSFSKNVSSKERVKPVFL